MKCPHCHVDFHDKVATKDIGEDSDGLWHIEIRKCPSCNRYVLHLVSCRKMIFNGMVTRGTELSRRLFRPKSPTRATPSKEVPSTIEQDYIEASIVLNDSPQASAALSRRCLQHMLREAAGVKPTNLSREIDEVLDAKLLPSHLSEAIDAIRNIGNFAAHSMKSTNTGEVLPVEPGEAEWTLDVLDGLFDFYFVQPTLLRKKRQALNAKLADANKPAMKG